MQQDLRSPNLVGTVANRVYRKIVVFASVLMQGSGHAHFIVPVGGPASS